MYNHFKYNMIHFKRQFPVVALILFGFAIPSPAAVRSQSPLLEFSRKAYAGDAQSQYVIGVDQQSRGNLDDARTWFIRAAEQGHARAQFCLAELYATAQGVKQNYSEAAKWYRRAADQGDDDAQCALGNLYEFGMGVDRNFTEAAAWFRKSAEKGNPVAQNSLGLMYAKGVGVSKDATEARKWLELSAARGNEDARSNLESLNRELPH